MKNSISLPIFVRGSKWYLNSDSIGEDYFRIFLLILSFRVRFTGLSIIWALFFSLTVIFVIFVMFDLNLRLRLQPIFHYHSLCSHSRLILTIISYMNCLKLHILTILQSVFAWQCWHSNFSYFNRVFVL